MPLVPLPFVVALLLIILFVRLAMRDEEPVNRFFLAMIAAYALQSVLLGLRWGYGVEGLRPLRPVLASTIPPLSWIGFSAFTAARAQARAARGPWCQMLPPAVIALLWPLAPTLIDPALILLFLGYGAALIALGRSGPDALDRVKLDGAISLHWALQVTGIVLIASAATDAAISLDFFRASGIHAAWVSGFASLCFITLLGFAAAMAGRSAPVADEEGTQPIALSAPSGIDPDESRIVADLDAMMRLKKLYCDPELSLDRLARKMLIPARRISTAINRTRAMNVSQYVNEHRISDACWRLSETDASVTQILFEVGFQTKSNFNREFLRVIGMSPSAWRAEQKQARTADDSRRLHRREDISVEDRQRH